MLGLIGVASIVAGSLLPLPAEAVGFSDKVLHGAAYAMLMFWFGQLYSPKWGVALVAAGLGISLEIGQLLIGYRYFEVLDILANVVGILIGWAALLTPLAGMLAVLDKKARTFVE